MLSNVQVQLLSILVSYGIKLRIRKEVRGVSLNETDELANREVQRIKSMLTGEAGEESKWDERLDQTAIDKLLADLGF